MNSQPFASRGQNAIPIFIVLLCAVLEPLLMNDMMKKLHIASNPIFDGVNHVVIGLWILTIWILLALIPHLFSLLYNSAGRFKDLLIETGYGFIPMLVGIGMSFYIFNNAVFPVNVDIQALEQNKVINTISWISKISMTLSLPWEVYVLQKFNKIKLIQAIICVVLPFAIIYLASNLLGQII